MRNYGGQEPLFQGVSWYAFSQARRGRMLEHINSIAEDEFLNTDAGGLAKYLAELYQVDVPQVDEAGIEVDQKEISLNNLGARGGYDIFRDTRAGPSSHPGVAITLSIPFTGDPEMLRVQPMTSPINGTPVSIGDGVIEARFETIAQLAGQIGQQTRQLVETIKGNLTNLKHDADSFNNQLVSEAANQISQRRERLLKNRQIAESLGFPLKRRADAEAISPQRVVKKKVTPVRPITSKGPFRPEPTLENQTYEEILKVLENMVLVMERSPKAFIGIDEPALRTHFLMQLNGQYEGQATGETFNFDGKTDILIRVDGKNIFIAECKFWTGPAGLTDAVNQLLGYASWRDTKVSILLFNRNKDLSAVLKSASDAVKAHPNFKRDLGQRSETSFRFQFRHRDDANRELILTLMCFDVPK